MSKLAHLPWFLTPSGRGAIWNSIARPITMEGCSVLSFGNTENLNTRHCNAVQTADLQILSPNWANCKIAMKRLTLHRPPSWSRSRRMSMRKSSWEQNLAVIFIFRKSLAESESSSRVYSNHVWGSLTRSHRLVLFDHIEWTLFQILLLRTTPIA